MKDKLILVAGGYGYGNMGDEAQCAATLQMLSLRYPGFQIRDLTPDTDYSLGAHPGFAHDYASRVEIFNQGRPHDAFRVKTLMRRIRFRLISALMLLNARLARRGWPLLMLNAARASFLRQIERASLFFFCGGGYLTGSTRSRLWDGALVCRLCEILGTPVVMSGQTIGVWSDALDRRIARRGFAAVRLIGTRDETDSMRDLREIGFAEDRMMATHDDALFCGKSTERVLPDGEWVVVNFHFWGVQPDRRDGLVDRIGEALDIVRREMPQARFAFLAMHESDTGSFEAFKRRRADIPFVAVNCGGDFRKARRAIAEARLVLTMKHHPIIFAIGEDVPVVSLSFSRYYEHKNLGALGQYGVADCSCSLEADDFAEGFRRALARAMDRDWFLRTVREGRRAAAQRKEAFMRRVDAVLGVEPSRRGERDFKPLADTLFDSARMNVLDRQKSAVPPTGDSVGTAIFRNEYGIVPALLPKLRFGRSADELGARPDWCFLWSNGVYYDNEKVLAEAISSDATLVLCEDGFLRSADTWANFKAPPRYRHGCSLVLDTLGCYYDATRESLVERMLNDKSLVVTAEQRAEARKLIDLIVGERLTKYNHQPMVAPEIGRPGRRKVLVVDQSYGDYAISKGWADASTFERMLADAVRDNPDADVIVKTHPDTLTGRRKGYYDGVKEGGNVFRATMPVNPYSLMELVDKVYVCSTQFGFEALMAGKEVYVYGMPFYAGWGLAHDVQGNPRRTNRRTLEEVFYIFYILYTRWYNPDTGRQCDIREAMDWLLKVRAEYSELRGRAMS